MRSKYKLLALATLFIAVTQTITPATALPRQSVKSFIRWARTRPMSTPNKHHLYYIAAPRTEKLGKLNVSLNQDRTVKFSKYNEKALKLILKLYNSHSSSCSISVSDVQCNQLSLPQRHRGHRRHLL